MKKIIVLFIYFLIMTSICSAAPVLHDKKNDSGREVTGIKYTVFVGLNDKYEYTQIIPTDRAFAILKELCGRYAIGYTVLHSSGLYFDGKQITEENGFVLIFYNVEESAVEKIAGEICTLFNQSSVLIERDFVRFRFYSSET